MVRASVVAVPDPITTAAELTPVRPVAVNDKVRLPEAPVMVRLVKVARPAPLVLAVSVPDKEPAPVATAAVTVIPACATALPAPSCT